MTTPLDEGSEADRTSHIQSIWSLAGPCDAAAITSAAAGVDILLRFISHATLPDGYRRDEALPDPTTAGQLLKTLGSGLVRLEQVLAQVQSYADSIRAGSVGVGEIPAQDAITDLEEALRALRELQDSTSRAERSISRLR